MPFIQLHNVGIKLQECSHVKGAVHAVATTCSQHPAERKYTFYVSTRCDIRSSRPTPAVAVNKIVKPIKY